MLSLLGCSILLLVTLRITEGFQIQQYWNSGNLKNLSHVDSYLFCGISIYICKAKRIELFRRGFFVLLILLSQKD